MPACKLCGAPNGACVGTPGPTIAAIGPQREANIMSELREYRVEATGRAGAIPATVLLSEEDAEKQGLTSKDLVRGGLKLSDTDPEIDARTTYADATPVTGGTGVDNAPAAATVDDVAALRKEIADLRSLLEAKEPDVNDEKDEKSGTPDDDKAGAADGQKAAPAPANKSRAAATK